MLTLDDKTSVIKNSFVLYLGSDSDSDDSPRKKKKKKDKKKRKKHKKVNIAWDLKDRTMLRNLMLLPIMINRITPYVDYNYWWKGLELIYAQPDLTLL